VINAVDFQSPDFINDPYPLYRRLRDAGEPHWLPHVQAGSTAPGMWLFSRYADVAEILKEQALLSKQITRIRAPGATSPLDFIMLNQDPPEHTRLRNLLVQAFTPARIKELEPRIEQIADELITHLSTKEEADFIADFAMPLPVTVIAELMGIPHEDRDAFRQGAPRLLIGYDSVSANPEVLAQQKATLQELINYFNLLIEKRRRQPDNALISALIKEENEQKKLSGSELLSMCMLFLVAGHETTLSLLGTGMLTLFRHPEQFELLKKHPEYLPSAIEEMLRFESPLQRSTFRVTAKACEIGGKQFREGEQISAIIGAANRDPEQFDQPDTFDITRSPNRHLAFGLGIHFCLGSTLARTEARIGFGRILERLPHISLNTNMLEWNRTTLFRGLRKLPVRA
jgi:cytochrome P450